MRLLAAQLTPRSVMLTCCPGSPLVAGIVPGRSATKPGAQMAEHGTFTKRRIEAMQAGTTLWDAGSKETVKGLGIRCRDGGTKTFCLKYRVTGRQRWLTLGKFGSPWTVDMARKEAKRRQGEV